MNYNELTATFTAIPPERYSGGSIHFNTELSSYDFPFGTTIEYSVLFNGQVFLNYNKYSLMAGGVFDPQFTGDYSSVVRITEPAKDPILVESNKVHIDFGKKPGEGIEVSLEMSGSHPGNQSTGLTLNLLATVSPPENFVKISELTVNGDTTPVHYGSANTSIGYTSWSSSPFGRISGTVIYKDTDGSELVYYSPQQILNWGKPIPATAKITLPKELDEGNDLNVVLDIDFDDPSINVSDYYIYAHLYNTQINHISFLQMVSKTSTFRLGRADYLKHKAQFYADVVFISKTTSGDTTKYGATTVTTDKQQLIVVPVPKLSVNSFADKEAVNRNENVTFTYQAFTDFPIDLSSYWTKDPDTRVPNSDTNPATFPIEETSKYFVTVTPVRDSRDVGDPVKSRELEITVNNSDLTTTIHVDPDPCPDITLSNSQKFTRAFTDLPDDAVTSTSWWVDGEQTLSSSPAEFTYTPTKAGDHTIQAKATVSGEYYNPSTIESNLVKVKVLNNKQEITVEIAPKEHADIAIGDSIDFTPTVSGQPTGATLTYEWSVNDNIVSRDTTFKYTGDTAGEKTIKCDVISMAEGYDPVTATSNKVTFNVTKKTLTTTVAVTPESASIHVNDSQEFTATFTDLPSDATPAIQWKVDGTVVPDEIKSTFTYTGTKEGDFKIQATATITGDDYNPLTINSNEAELKASNNTQDLTVTVSPDKPDPVTIGDTVKFTAAVTGQPDGATLAYAWSVNDAVVSGETKAEFDYTPTDSGNKVIKCEVTSTADGYNPQTADSNPITLVVNKKKFTTIVAVTPESASIHVDDSQVFTATFSNLPSDGKTAISWKVDDVVVPNETGTTYTYTGTKEGTFSVQADATVTGDDYDPLDISSNKASVVVSNKDQHMTVNVTPENPDPITLGDSIKFTATVSGQAPGATLTYEWFVDGSEVSGATDSEFTYTPTKSGSDTIECSVTATADGYNPVTVGSNSVHLTTNKKTLTTTVHVTPETAAIHVNDSQVFTAAFTDLPDDAKADIKWTLDGTVVPNETGTTYTYTGTKEGNYKVQAEATVSGTDYNSLDIKSNEVSVVVSNNAQNVSVKVTPEKPDPITLGDSIKFTAAVTGQASGATLTYVWNVDGSPVTGETKAEFTYAPTDSGSKTIYCTVTSTAAGYDTQTADSNTVTLSVNKKKLSTTMKVTPETVPPMTIKTSKTFTASYTDLPQDATAAISWFVDDKKVDSQTAIQYTFSPLEKKKYTLQAKATVSGTDYDSSDIESNVVDIEVINKVQTPTVSITPTGTQVDLVGNVVKFTATVTGQPDGATLAYVWNNNDTPIPNETGSTFNYTVVNAEASIRCDVTSTAEDYDTVTVKSNVTKIVPEGILSVTVSPKDAVVYEKTPVTYTATTIGATEPDKTVFEWKVNGEVQSSTTDTMVYTPANAGQYEIEVKASYTPSEGEAQTSTDSTTLTVQIIHHDNPHVHPLPWRSSAYIWVGWWVMEEIQSFTVRGKDWKTDEDGKYWISRKILNDMLAEYPEVDVQESRHGYIIHRTALESGYIYDYINIT